MEFSHCSWPKHNVRPLLIKTCSPSTSIFPPPGSSATLRPEIASHDDTTTPVSKCNYVRKISRVCVKQIPLQRRIPHVPPTTTLPSASTETSYLALHFFFNVAREISWPEEPHASSHIPLVLAPLLLIRTIRHPPFSLLPYRPRDRAGTHSTVGVAGGVAGPLSSQLFKYENFCRPGFDGRISEEE